MNIAEASTSNSNGHHQSPPPERSGKKELWRCLPLYCALLRGDDESEKIIQCIVTPDVMSKKITGAGDTYLHVLAGARNWLELKRHESDLISYLTRSGENLTARNRDGLTPLCVAATVGNVQAARKLLMREKYFEWIDPSVRALNEAVGPYPIIEAARYGHKEMVLLLIKDMERKMSGSPPTKESAASLFLHLLVEAGFYDLLLALVRRNPGLARAEFYGDNNESLLSLMAEKPSAFRSGIQLSFWQQLLYSVTHANLQIRLADIEKSLVEVQITAIDLPTSPPGQPPPNVSTWECFIKCLFHCFITILKWPARAIYRCMNYVANEDTSGNNILHMAGKLAPLGRLNLISGAALQMQRELQWFQEVEKFVHPTFKTKRNSKGKTPKMVFTEEHKQLVKEGEKWMKETANSCIFVAALTATVGFAAAITVPGGNNQNTGFPLFSNERAFTVFAVSVAFCLFSSVASLLMFLSILTSRNAEEDFLKRLPKRLILGLSTLFISMTSLMIAFGATIYLVFGQKKGWILIPVGIAALIPVILFESLQFSLLLDMIMSTYGPSIFRKQSSRVLY